jgi:predicted exporter
MTAGRPDADRDRPSPAASFVNWRLTLLTVVVLGTMAAVGLQRIEIDSDVVASLPGNDPVIAASRSVIRHHPAQDRVVVDIHLTPPAPDRLVALGTRVTEAMQASGLFEQVGFGPTAAAMPAVLDHVVTHLPTLFSAQDLETRVRPLLTPETIAARLGDALTQLSELQGIGQAALIARDPLALRNSVLARLAHLTPARDIRFVGGHLLSGDGEHLLIVAKPAGSGTDTDFSRPARALFDELAQAMPAWDAAAGHQIQLTPVGAFRAALDNESMARRDVRKIIWFATAGIALLLLFTFPRPWIGLLAFLPAVAGTVTALFVMSIVHRSLSVMTLGFGGAVIAITVDHGIAYLLFLDRGHATQGRDAAREVLAVGLIAALTTAGAFLALSLSGFPLLAQIGQFAACGIACSFIFVHTVFPRLIPVMPPARRRRLPALQRGVNHITRRVGLKTMLVLLALAVVLGATARPRFEVDLRAMNSVAAETRAAEKRLETLWGNIFDRVFVMLEADSLAALSDRNDALAPLLDREVAAGTIQSGFTSSALFPGPGFAARNQAAWKAFWTADRVARLRRDLAAVGQRLGFAPGAFAPFLQSLDPPPITAVSPPAMLFDMLGIVAGHGDQPWRQFYSLKPGNAYRAALFFDQLRDQAAAVLFDPVFFAERLGDYLARTFRHMLVVIGASAVLLLLVFLADLTLVGLALLPLGFALAATLGVLGLAGRSLDIPALMLSIIVLGMGIDYALFTVRAYQRYGFETDPELGLFRTAVFMAAASTLIGFGALMSAEHAVFRSAGLTSFLGIGFSFLGAFLLLPGPLRWLFDPARAGFCEGGNDASATREVRRRFRHLELKPRLAAWRQRRGAALLAELSLPLPAGGKLAIFPIDFGAAAAWLACRHPGLTVVGAEPRPARARVAARVLGAPHQVVTGGPGMLPADTMVGAVFVDLGYFSKPTVLAANDVHELFRRLSPGGVLVILAPDRKREGGVSSSADMMRTAGLREVSSQPVDHRPGWAWVRGFK